jgi:predicted nuclease of predicted toxin-antitoxin system
MKIKFQADADLKIQIIKAAKRLEPEIDFKTAYEADLSNKSDTEVLEVAAAENRVVVSHDRKTMPYSFAEFIQKAKSPGIIIIGQNKNIQRVVEDIALIWWVNEAEELANQILVLPFIKF